MPTNLHRIEVLHTEVEAELLRTELKASGESASNYYRRLRGLSKLKRGAEVGNQRAKKKSVKKSKK